MLLCPAGRATLTSLPQEVLETIGNHLRGNDKVGAFASPFTCVPSQQGICHLKKRVCSGVQSHLALCCKATLPLLCIGHVRVRSDNQAREWLLLQATRCLTKQPGRVSHLEVAKPDYLYTGQYHLAAHQLV